MRKLFAPILIALIPLALLAGCGGGGGSSMAPPPPPPPPTTATAGPPNVESVKIDGGPTALTIPAINTAFVSVQVCPHGSTTNCQTVDHIEIDTGSVGLRILRSSSFTLALAPQLAADNVTPLAECLQFADGTSWGSLNVADITLPVSMETASNIIVHVIGDPSVGSPPAACSGTTENTVETFGANGILGVGPFVNDCNSNGNCIPGSSATYFTCTSSTNCNTTTVDVAHQVPNPVVQFAKHADGSQDNNGVILELPSVASAGVYNPTGGVLVFGIGTQSNNTKGNVTTLLMDLNGFISASLNSNNFPHSYLDSGSNANFFVDASLVKCAAPNDGFYCVGSTSVNESATLQGTDGTMLMAGFTVADAVMQFNGNTMATAFPNLAGPNPDATSLDLGLSFFYGRNIYTGFENGPSGPYFAY